MHFITIRAKFLPVIFLLTFCVLILFFSGKIPDSVVVFSSSDGRQLPIYSVETKEKAVALGINCAWDEQDIRPMLDTLSQYKVKVTFFMLGEWAQKYPQQAKEIALSGQEIGSHAFRHRDMDQLSRKEILEEISSSQQVIEQTCGQRPILFRPPSGAYNDLVIRTIHEAGCIPIQWSIDTLDWKGLSAEEITQRVISKLKPGEIILLHAGGTYSAQALPMILTELKKAGYQVLPVGKLLLSDDFYVDASGRQIPFQNNCR